MGNQILRFIDWVLADAFKDEDERFKGRMVVIICFIAIVILLPVTIYDSLNLFTPTGVFFAWFDYAASWIALLALRISRSLKLATRLYLVSIVVATIAPIYFGSAEGFSNLIWLPLFPMMACFIADIRTGAFITILEMALGSLAIASQSSPAGLSQTQTSALMNLNIVLAGNLVVGMMYERYRTLWVTARATMLAELDRMAHVDELTQLSNRRTFVLALEKLLNGPADERTPAAIAQIDVDHFKRINDLYGHQSGDAALQALGGVFRECLKEDGHAGRLGGEEFGLILPKVDLGQALVILERLRTSIESKTISLPGQGEIRVTVSIGVTLVDANDQSHDVLRRADIALYKAKNEGRNQIAAYELLSRELKQTG
ncbi:MAG TPA: GGDEF domain-containing protein [Thermoanaerobaculia bacterium]|jgi:diguanylate cyclase (GGDEF) domain|nr:GGDEF domain-containing protein [Thermoanaerobaculia bacterium]